MSDTARSIRLSWHMYRHYPPDFSRWRESETGFGGWDEETRGLDLEGSCLAMMHFDGRGLTPETEWGPDCPNPCYMGTISSIPRTMDVIVFRMPRLIEAAREADWQIAHVGVSSAPYTEGDIWEQCVEEAGEPPEGYQPPSEAGEPDWKAQHRRDVFNLPRPNPPDAPEYEFYLPESMLPHDRDIIARHPWQLDRLLCNRGITHIIYTGWALNWCLWFSPCGMHDMNRRGYLCSAVRGGCVAIENKESTVGEQNLEYALWKTSTMFGYVFELHELTHALRQHAGNI